MVLGTLKHRCVSYIYLYIKQPVIKSERFDCKTSTREGKKETLGGHTQNLVHTETQGKRAVTQNRHPQAGLAQSEGLLWRHGLIGPALGTGALATAVLGGIQWHRSFWR